MNVMLVQHKYHKYYTFIIYTRKRNEKAREIGKIAVDFLKFIKINLFIFLFYFALISPFAMVSRNFILMDFFYNICKYIKDIDFIDTFFDNRVFHGLLFYPFV